MADRDDRRHGRSQRTDSTAPLASATSFLDEAPLDWANPAAQDLRRLLASAYPNVDAIQDITSGVGVHEHEIAWSPGSAREVWKRVLDHLSRAGRLVDFVVLVLEDPKVATFHADLDELRRRPPRVAGGPPLKPDDLAALVDRVRTEGPQIDLSDVELQQLRTSDPRTPEAYRLRRIADWREPHLLGRGEDLRRFTRLGLLVDKGENAQLRWSEESHEYNDLREIVRAAGAQYRVLVVLGEPGAGKTTLLRRLEIELACEGLGWEVEDGLGPQADRDGTPADRTEAAAVPLPFYLSLAEHADAALDPLEWLKQCWSASYPEMPALEELLDRQPVILLLDALNEIPFGGERPTYEKRVLAWRRDLGSLHRHHPNASVIISCRSLDYSTFLSSEELRVPHVQVKRLGDDQIREFLKAYRPELASALWDTILDSGQIDIYRTPYFLRLLVDQVGDDGHVPEGRAALFAGFVRQSLLREFRKENPLLIADDLLHPRERQLVAQMQGHALPRRGPLFGALARLAYGMQTQSGAGQQVIIDYDDALALLGGAFDESQREEIVRAGSSLGVIDRPFDSKLGLERLRFNHQLMQEFFAARILAEHPQPERAHIEWRADQVTEPLERTVAGLEHGDPLPSLEQTGWEVTMRLATVMTAHPDAFVTALAEANLPLAARGAAEPGAEVSGTLKTELRQRLVARCGDVQADLRARIDAAHALGEIGDDRFRTGRSADGRRSHLVPPMALIPRGRFTIGATDGWSDERPVHKVDVRSFEIGRFPVTNAEFRCFVENGGYSDESWWETADAKAWLHGDPSVLEPAKQWQRDRWARYPKDDAGFAEWRTANSRETESRLNWVDWFRRLDEEALEAHLEEWYPSKRYTAPHYWTNPRNNQPAQPVVGVSWYEARAYCDWLSARTDRLYRLPTEVEWEAACRGPKGRRFAYGDRFDVYACNTYESHIRGTTPIDVFPAGRTPEGLVDMTGNVWEWTLSLWGRDTAKPDFGYPYDGEDGRETVDADSGRLRVLRGGSWLFTGLYARAAYRSWYFPSVRHPYYGFRLVCASPISPGT